MPITIEELLKPHEVKTEHHINSLGDSVLLRELSRDEINKFLTDTDKDGNVKAEAITGMIAASLTDETGIVMTPEQVVALFGTRQRSITDEIADKIIKLHFGSETGNG